MTCIGYIRVSSEKQDSGDGPDRQREAIERWCKHNGHDLTECLSESISGTTPLAERPVLQGILSECRNKGVELVVVENADRFARDLVVGELALEAFRNAGVQVWSAAGNVNMTENGDPMAKMVRQIIGAVAENAKDTLVNRMRQARDRIAAATGKRPEGRPKMERGKPSKRLVELVRAGWGYRQVAEILNHQNMLTLTGKQWTKASVFKEWRALAGEGDRRAKRRAYAKSLI